MGPDGRGYIGAQRAFQAEVVTQGKVLGGKWQQASEPGGQ